MHWRHRIAASGVAVLFLIGGGALVARGPFGKARARAQEAACRANLRQVSMAMLLYLADHDDRYPPAERWSYRVYPYLRNDLVFSCPAERSVPRGYAMDRSLAWVQRTTLAQPGETPVLFEARLKGRNRTEARNPAGSPSQMLLRHPGGGFYATADGRVSEATRAPGR